LFLTFVYFYKKEGLTMADTIRKISYFSVEVPDKPGEGARILQALKKAGVNLLAFSGFPRRRRVQLDFVPEETRLFRKALSQEKLKIKPKKSGFLVQGNDRTGAVAEIVQKLSDANINITAMDAVSAGRGRYGAILWVKPPYVNKAAKVLKAL
jgi:prephenate dehydratase